MFARNSLVAGLRVAVAGTAVLGLAIAILPSRAAASGLKVVVFDVEAAQVPLTADIKSKLATETELLRKMLSDKGFTIVDATPQAKKIADNMPLSQCNGCDQDIAKSLGADLEVATALQPVSAATFTLSGSIKDVATDRVLRQGVVDIRGEDVAVWNHGMKFLLKERLLDPPLPGDQAALKAAVQTLSKTEN